MLERSVLLAVAARAFRSTDLLFQATPDGGHPRQVVLLANKRSSLNVAMVCTLSKMQIKATAIKLSVSAVTSLRNLIKNYSWNNQE